MYEISVAAEYAVICSTLLVAVIFIVWLVEGLLRLSTLLLWLMYALFLSAFAAPFVFSRESYMWLRDATMCEHHWILFTLAGVPDLAFLTRDRPRGRFGARFDDNSWRPNSLEWATNSPLVFSNFKIFLWCTMAHMSTVRHPPSPITCRRASHLPIASRVSR